MDDVIGYYLFESHANVWHVSDIEFSRRFSDATEFSDPEDAEQMKIRAERHNPNGTFYVFACMGSR
jgi:hypothetical protein